MLRSLRKVDLEVKRSSLIEESQNSNIVASGR